MGFADLVAAADRAVLANLGGVEVVYTPVFGSPVTVTGVFDEDTFGGPDLSGPAVFVRLEDLPEDPMTQGATVTISGTVYTIRAVEPYTQAASQGGIRLWLVEVT